MKENMPPQITIFEQTFICLVCHQLFYSQLELAKHFGSSHGDESFVLNRDDDLEEKMNDKEEEEEEYVENEHKVVDVFWPRFC